MEFFFGGGGLFVFPEAMCINAMALSITTAA